MRPCYGWGNRGIHHVQFHTQKLRYPRPSCARADIDLTDPPDTTPPPPFSVGVIAIVACAAALVLALPSIFPPTRQSAAAEKVEPGTSLFSTDDYPAAALRKGEEGLVAVGLDIDADGSVGKCTVSESSGSGTLDAATCNIIRQRARYRPARDAEGGAMRGNDEMRIRWLLPVTPYLSRTVDTFLTFDRSGNLNKCDSSEGGFGEGCVEAGPAIHATFGGDTGRAAAARAGRSLAFRRTIDTGIGADTPPVPDGWQRLWTGTLQLQIRPDGKSAGCTVVDESSHVPGDRCATQTSLDFERSAGQSLRSATVRQTLFAVSASP